MTRATVSMLKEDLLSLASHPCFRQGFCYWRIAHAKKRFCCRPVGLSTGLPCREQIMGPPLPPRTSCLQASASAQSMASPFDDLLQSALSGQLDLDPATSSMSMLAKRLSVDLADTMSKKSSGSFGGESSFEVCHACMYLGVLWPLTGAASCVYALPDRLRERCAALACCAVTSCHVFL
jgi:hypothetical protein